MKRDLAGAIVAGTLALAFLWSTGHCAPYEVWLRPIAYIGSTWSHADDNHTFCENPEWQPQPYDIEVWVKAPADSMILAVQVSAEYDSTKLQRGTFTRNTQSPWGTDGSSSENGLHFPFAPQCSGSTSNSVWIYSTFCFNSCNGVNLNGYFALYGTYHFYHYSSGSFTPFQAFVKMTCGQVNGRWPWFLEVGGIHYGSNVVAIYNACIRAKDDQCSGSPPSCSGCCFIPPCKPGLEIAQECDPQEDPPKPAEPTTWSKVKALLR